MGKDKAATAHVVAEVEELPRTIVRRVVKDKLSEVSSDSGDVILHKEALIAFSESARIFIHYLSATAHDICNESRRQIINVEDVLNALEEIEFSEFVEPLRETLDEFRKKAAGKRAGAAKAKDVSKKRKVDEDATSKKGGAKAKKKHGKNADEVEGQAHGDGDNDDEVEGQAHGDTDDEDDEQASGDNDNEVEGQASGDNDDEAVEQASGDEDEVDEQASEDEDGAEEQASGDEDEVEEQVSGDNEEQASGDEEDVVEEQSSEE